MEVSLTLTSRFDVFSDQDQSDSRGVLLRYSLGLNPPAWVFMGFLFRLPKEYLCFKLGNYN